MKRAPLSSSMPIKTIVSPMKARRSWPTFTTRALLCGLTIGIFWLRTPGLLLVALGACLLISLILAYVRPVHPVAGLVLALFGYWFMSGFLSGSVTFGALSSPEFWRGEGRCFLFYVPLLATSALAIKRSDLTFLIGLVSGLTVVGMLLWSAWLAGFGDTFQAEQDPTTGELLKSTYFVGLLTSHTGAGAFWGTVAAFLLGVAISTRRLLTGSLALAAMLLTLSTGGRAATLGMLAAATWTLFDQRARFARQLPLAVPVLAVLFVAGRGVVSTVPEINDRMVELFDDRAVRSVTHEFQAAPLDHASGTFYSGANLEHHNLVIRVFLWKYAWRLFRHSPLLGIGFGRFNDTNLEYSGIPHLIYVAFRGDRHSGAGIRWETGQLMSSTGNAHNSYLHTLAETGVLGLCLMLYLWYAMFHYCSPRADDLVCQDPVLRGFGLGCQCAIVCLLATAMAGHALAAPSGGIVLTTLIGCWLGFRTWSATPPAATLRLTSAPYPEESCCGGGST